MSEDTTSPSFIVRSEYGAVVISKDTTANGDRVRIEGLNTGAVLFLDPLELESIASVGPEVLALVVSPEART